jgi:predicted PurR-regulated permease PerM
VTERLRRAGQTSWALVGIAAVLAVLGLLAWFIRVVFPPLILAGAIVFILNPVVTRLQRRGVPRALGATFAYVCVLGAFVGAGFLLVPLATSQGDELAEEWPAIEQRVERWVDDRSIESEGTFWEFTRQELTETFSQDDATLKDRLTRLRDLSVEVFHVLLVLFLAPVIAFYLLVDLPHLRRTAVGLIPEPAREEVLHVAHRLNRAIGGFFRGQLLVAAIVGIMCSIGLLIIGLRFWFLVGIIAGLFNVIPLIGPWVGGIPGVVIALTTGSPLQAAGVVAVMVAAQQIDNHFITPQVMHRTVQLHPAAVILALLAGGTIAGFFGLLLAVPVAAVLKILIGHAWRVHVLGEPLAVEAAAVAAEEGPGLVEDVVSLDRE